MIESNRAPSENAVATSTIGAKSALVNVVLTMAGFTVAVARIAEIQVAVTGFAGQAFVAAEQPKSSYHEVIERRILPGRYAVTIRTLGTVSSFVNVIRLMAGDAGTPDLCEVVLHMAGAAANAHVPTAKGKTCAIVIEFRVNPVAIAVARGAVIPQLPFVHIVRPMAVNTAGRCVPMHGIRGVTVAARDVQMCSVQWEVGNPVIEAFLVKVDNVHIPTLVIGMTTRTVELL
jgi:hypothetical protein